MFNLPSLAIKRKNTFKAKRFMLGDKCTVTNDGDLFCIAEARDFIDAECVFIKQTKAGLIQVALINNHKKTYSVPLRNIRDGNGNILKVYYGK